MAKKNKRKNKRNKGKTFSLRGANNWETMLNTLNTFIGWIMTLVWGAGSLTTTGAEVTLDIAPEKIAKAIHNTATKGDGIMDTLDSFMAEDSSEALADTFYETKNRWLGDRSKKAANETKHLDKAIKALSKQERRDVKKVITMAKAVVKGLTDEKISKLVKKHGVKEAMKKVKDMMLNA